jgi:hypothetical protein
LRTELPIVSKALDLINQLLPLTGQIHEFSLDSWIERRACLSLALVCVCAILFGSRPLRRHVASPRPGDGAGGLSIRGKFTVILY